MPDIPTLSDPPELVDDLNRSVADINGTVEIHRITLQDLIDDLERPLPDPTANEHGYAELSGAATMRLELAARRLRRILDHEVVEERFA